MKIWVIYRADYDEYDDIAYFTDELQAKKALAICKKYSRFYRRKPLYLKQVDANLPEDKWIQTFVRMDKEGRLDEAKTDIFEDDGIVAFDSESKLLNAVNTSDKEYAIKVTETLRKKLLEEKKWGEEPKRVAFSK